MNEWILPGDYIVEIYNDNTGMLIRTVYFNTQEEADSFVANYNRIKDGTTAE